MAVITAAMVKELRDKTDAGMMDCKKALTETNGDMEAAVEFLRKSGMAKAEKRADKATKEGKVFAAVDGSKAVMIEVLCETDFVAKNEKFYDYVKEAAARVLAGTSGEGDVTAKAQEIENDKLAELFVKFGEKMVLRRALRYEIPGGTVASYMHGEGKIVAPVSALEEMKRGGQIATQYVDLAGKPTMVSPFNPNGSAWAIEGITSPDGRVFGKMGHAERIGENLYKNYAASFDMKLFESGVDYFK